ncbi:MAG: T9SS type A sorting domain-containing protein [Agriterribacter sp.]
MSKNKVLSIIWSAVFMFLCINKSNAQTDIKITFVGGTYSGITISESGKLYFSGSDLVVSTDGISTLTIPLATIRKLTFETSTSLPVSLLSFNAKSRQSKVLLEWTTASEQNNKHFELERSADGNQWITIGTIESMAENGNSQSLLSYNFTDENPLNGKNCYRLKQVDYDGKYKFSAVCSVSFEKENSVKIYPNPTSKSITIETGNMLSNATISVFNIAGKIALKQTISGTNATLDISALPAGSYMLKLENNGKTLSAKFIKN